ncbi:uncharacterized protein [Setaria viridis]|uniref:uncharacterized protein n=1 Tax=Setaria viridis TaxID=4556 RepID=UPI001493D499|nr:uncharacterized protein LOC117834624 [Setaria viridis]
MAAADDMDFAPSPLPIECAGRDHTQTVEAFVVLGVVAMFLLHVLGSLRRRSSHGLLHSIMLGVYTLSYPLVSYTIGWMQSSDWYDEDFAVWAVFLLLLLGSTDSLTACRLNEIDSWKSIYVKHLFKGFLLAYVMYMIYGWHMPPHLLPLTAILHVVILKWYLRIVSMRMVSKSYLCKNMKVIAEYMEHKDNPLVPFNPVTMEGYRYMVAGERYCVNRPRRTPWYKQEEGLKVTTVQEIWQCKGNLLLHERGNMLKDVCLSMALSKMLNRRFAGFKLSEAELEKTHDFVFKGLLAGDKPYQRAFRVIEEELAFVHDLYYTRYSYLYQKGRYLTLCLPVIMLALCSWLTCLLVKEQDRSLVDSTIFITVVVAFLEAYQLYLYLASGWFKVALIRSYVTTPFLQRNGCFLEMIIGLLLRLKAFRPWKYRLGQYCILQDLGRTSWLSNCLHYSTLGLVDKAKKGRKNSVKLSENVKKAIVDSLLRSNGHLANGVTSLRNNGVHADLSWARDAIATDGTVTHTILVWHIATTLCEHQLDAQAKEEDASTNEAGELLRGAKTLDSKCEKLMKTSTRDGNGGEAPPLVAKGAELARHLIEDIQDTKLRWKILSDFWAEMMLSVSPSDDARAHLEALARGGEFITHLWALLTHAGVLKQVPDGPNNV